MNHPTNTPKIGVALGSGASRGWSHIGILNALEKEGIVPDIICGTSVGAIIGGSYAAGNLERLEQWVSGASRSDVLRFFGVNYKQSGFVDVERLNGFLHRYIADSDQQIQTLPTKYAAVATDLDTGREIWLTKGNLTAAVRASMALPGLFPPVNLDQRWLVDGGLVNPVPVSVCRALGADVVVAVNLNSGIVGKSRGPHKNESPVAVPTENSGLLNNLMNQAKEYSNSIFPDHEKPDEAPGLFYAIASSINIFQDRVTRSRLAGDPADLLLAPDLAHIGMLEFHRAVEAINEGERCVKAALPEIHRLISK